MKIRFIHHLRAIRWLAISIAAIPALFLGVLAPVDLHAQPQITLEQLTNLPPVDPSQIPAFATFWEWFYGRNGQGVAAPLPTNPYGPEVPVYALGNGQYFINNGPDDLNLFQQQQLESQMNLASSTMASDTTSEQADTPTQLTPSFPPGTFYICSIAVTGQVINLVLTNTVQDVTYEILSKDSLTNTADWTSEGTVLGLSNSTPATVWMGYRTNQLFLWARSWADTSGSGIPDWWMMNYFGPDQTTWPDAFADLNGDGHTILEAYYNGWNPCQKHLPPPPQNVAATSDSTLKNITITWNSGGGPVTSYVIESSLYASPSCTHSIGQVGSNTFSFVDHPSHPVAGNSFIPPDYRVWACFSDGSSNVSPFIEIYKHDLTLDFHLVRGMMGQWYIAAPAFPSSASAIHVFPDTSPFGEPPPWPDFFIGSSNIVNGLVPVTDQQFALISQGAWVQAVGAGASFGDERWLQPGTAEQVGSAVRTNTFVNAAAQLKQNLRFLLRSATANYPFSYVSDVPTDLPGYTPVALNDPSRPEQNFSRPGTSTNYEYYGFRTFSYNLNYSVLQEVRPVYENFLWRNFVSDPVSQEAFPQTGYYPDMSQGAVRTLTSPLPYQYTGSGTETPLPLALTDANWIYFRDLEDYPPTGWFDWLTYAELDISFDANTNYVLPAVVQNCFGLQLNSLYSWPDVLIQPNSTTDPVTVNPRLLPNFSDPSLQTESYYFVSQTPFLNNKNGVPRPPIPGSPDFTVNMSSPLLIAPFGQPFAVSGWAKQAVGAPNSGKYAYLEQYFDAALTIDSNGNVTTNSAGLLSPYGEFFPNMPGPAALVTMADIDPPYERGTGVVNVIKLQLDVNHDGIMDLSFGGPDNTSADHPFVFWINNDHDEPGVNGLMDRDIPPEPTRIETQDCSHKSIHSVRDLEDFARLWICGLPALPETQSFRAELSLVPYSGNPAINLCASFDADGSPSYLTNAAAAAAQFTQQFLNGQLYFDYAKKLATIDWNHTYTIPVSVTTGAAQITHFLFEGAGIGTGQLVLTVYKGTNIVAQTSAWIDLHDIKELYEQAVVTNVERQWPEMVQQDVVSGFKVIRYPDISLIKTNQIAIFVHGWRVPIDDYFSFSETMFKRLYWQGYQGGFCSLTWPTRSEDTDPFFHSDYVTYNRSEYIALESGTGTADYLNDLRRRFPDSTISLCAHSMGNVVIMEALRQLTAAQSAPIDNYVLMQAAVPAQCYDTTVTNFPDFISVEGAIPTPDSYRDYGAGTMAALRAGGQMVNFFNPLDFALNTWTLNESFYLSETNGPITMKPNTLLGYYTDGTSHLLQTNSWNQSLLSVLYGGYYNGATRSVTNLYEIMPFISRPRSKAVGAQAGIQGQIRGAEINLQTAFGFGSASWDHSGQWNRNIQDPAVLPFYFQLKRNLFPTAP